MSKQKTPEPATQSEIRAGQTVYFGAHGGPNGEVLPLVALLCRLLPPVEGEMQQADLYIFNSLTGQSGFAYKVPTSAKLRIGTWSTTTEYEIAAPVAVETRSPGDRIDAPEANQQATTTPKDLDPDVDGIPNVFGGVTKFNAAVNRWQHSNEHGELLWICPDNSCKRTHWIKRGAPIPGDLGCCSDNMRRRQFGRQSEPEWVEQGLWRIPSSAPVGTEHDSVA